MAKTITLTVDEARIRTLENHLRAIIEWYGNRHPVTDELLPPYKQPEEIREAMRTLEK